MAPVPQLHLTAFGFGQFFGVVFVVLHLPL
jgi:hypothetical protein